MSTGSMNFKKRKSQGPNATKLKFQGPIRH